MADQPERRSPRTGSHRSQRRWATAILAVVALLGASQFQNRARTFLPRPFEVTQRVPRLVARPSLDAFGVSGGVTLRVVLPGDAVTYPLTVDGDPSALRYQWVPVGDTVPAGAALPLAGATVRAPMAPGFYRLALVRGTQRHVLDELTVGVLVPFSAKLGSATLNGYHIGTYLAEKLGGAHERPDGFLPVTRDELDLRISKHLRLADFVSPDRQQSWPRYVALNPRLLDKIELVLAQLGAERQEQRSVAVNVHSGFRTPGYNRTVARAARDSRHQYGDAADLAIDADGDGRLTAKDSRLVALAVERVEKNHPDLAGGMGVYTSRRVRTPYVHIDARGRRARWRG